MHRHPYEWPILAENQWPNHGRKLTPTKANVGTSMMQAGPRCQRAATSRLCRLALSISPEVGSGGAVSTPAWANALVGKHSEGG
jgi:hypothetical protein